MNIIKKIINVLTTLIIVIGGVFLGLYFLGITPYVVLSGSMEPTIDTGSLCFINTHASFKNIKEKDIIAYKLSDGTLVTHRAIEINDLCVVTKGDNNNDNDGCNTNQNNFVGENIFWIPKVGYIVMGLQSTKGKIIFLTFIVVLFTVGILFGEDKKKKNNNDKEKQKQKEIIEENK